MSLLSYDIRKVTNCIHVGHPTSLQNCSVVNQSSAGLQVECVEGFDGGLTQTFYMEVLEVPSMIVSTKYNNVCSLFDINKCYIYI